MKKLLVSFFMLVAGFSCFAFDFSDEVAVAINKIIPAKNTLIQVITPTYSETDAASKFSVYLKNEIEIALSNAGKELFSLDADRQTELFLAELKDSGYESNDESWTRRKFPDGVLASTFIRQGDKVQVFFSYRQFAGNTKKSSMIFSANSLQRMKYEPDNYELAKDVTSDFSKADILPKSDFRITAAMLDEENNVIDILHPNDTVRFMIATSKDAYISILCIDANGNKNWLPIRDNRMIAGEVRTFPDLNNTVFKVVDNVYGTERIIIYASTSPKGLPEQDTIKTYQQGDIQQISRGIIAVKENAVEGYESSPPFEITYTVMEKWPIF